MKYLKQSTKRIIFVSGGLVLTGLLVLMFLSGFDRSTVGFFSVEKSSSGGTWVLLLLGETLSLGAHLWFIFQGFRTHWGWGLANLFLMPFSYIAFFTEHRQRALLPTKIFCLGVVFWGLGMVWPFI